MQIVRYYVSEVVTVQGGVLGGVKAGGVRQNADWGFWTEHSWGGLDRANAAVGGQKRVVTL